MTAIKCVLFATFSACMLFLGATVERKMEPPVEAPLQAVYTPAPAPFFKESEIQCLRNVIYGEARGEHVIAQMAVGATVINRSFDSRWPSDLCDVAKQKNQFHGYKDSVTLRNSIDVKSWDKALKVATYLTSRYYQLPARMRLTYYFHSGTDQFKWAEKFVIITELGSFTFYG